MKMFGTLLVFSTFVLSECLAGSSTDDSDNFFYLDVKCSPKQSFYNNCVWCVCTTEKRYICPKKPCASRNPTIPGENKLTCQAKFRRLRGYKDPFWRPCNINN